ncbi:putative periplasmic protein [Campylobacter jejuni subsp. jejuni M129]|nr:putative periplasmic protein [Campylobacter jejuni subsp. jejuni M129]
MQKHTKIHGFAKFKLIVILALMSSIAPLSTDMYLPALSHVEQSFQTNSFLTQLSIASFFIAFALGQLIYGPLSDIFGRKIPALVGIFFFIVSSLFCVIIDDIYAFIALRFFEALGGCAGVVIARAIVNDLFEIKEAAGIFALMMVFSSLAPMLSPTFGGILLEYFSWHSIFATLFALGILLFLMILFGLKESAPHLKNKKFSHHEAMKSYKFVLSDKRFLVYILCASFALAAMFAYITGSSFVFTQFFSLSEQKFALLFGANALGFISFAVGVINANAPIIFVFVNVYLRIGCKYDIFSNQNKGEKMKTNNIFMALAIVLASLILAFGFNKALSDFKTLERSVSVKGLSQKEVEADTLILPIKFTRSNNNLTNLYEELEQDKENIIKFLKEQGVKEDEINYNSPNIIDRLSDPYSNDTQAVYRYIGTANLLIYTQNVKLGKSILENISSLAKFGIVTKIDDYDIEYLYTKLNEIKPQMIEEATLNARNAAIKFAQDSNSHLGKIKKASQGQFSINNRDKNTPYIKTIRVVSTIEYYLKD